MTSNMEGALFGLEQRSPPPSNGRFPWWEILELGSNLATTAMWLLYGVHLLNSYSPITWAITAVVGLLILRWQVRSPTRWPLRWATWTVYWLSMLLS